MTREKEPDHSLVDDAEEDEDDDVSVASSTPSNDGALGTSKKKKKRKKKKGDAAKPTIETHETNVPSTSGVKAKYDKDMEKRYNAALEIARKGDDLWIDLADCQLTMARTKKLLEALKLNGSVTSVNLSNSSINDEAVQAIAGMLGVNGASAVIDLDLRDNPLTDTGLNTLAGLKKLRKKLEVRTGSSLVTEPEALAITKSGPGKEGSSGTLRDSFSKGKMFKKFFQTGDEEDEAVLARQESQLDDRGVNPEELWAGIKESLKQNPVHVPELGVQLQQLCSLLDREVRVIQSQHSNPLDGSKPHLKVCISNLDTLKACLACVPRKVTVQYSEETQNAVGTHRVAAVEAVATLLFPNNTTLDKVVAASKLVPLVVHLAISHPLCSAVHARAMRVVRSCFTSSVLDLCMPMLSQRGWGCGLLEPSQLLQGLGISPASQDGDEQQQNGDAAASPACRPLPELLAAAGCATAGVQSGRRSRGIGFVLEMSKVLLEVSEAPLTEGAKALQMSSSWREFVSGGDAWISSDGADGCLRALIREQDQELCGPKPERPPPEEAADMSGGGLMSGRDILALLQSMSLGGGMSSFGGGL